MKKFGLLFASALALLALAACNDEEDDITPNEEQGDAYWAAQATVSSSDVNFTATDNGGTIQFKTEGGSVTLNVSCGCEWIAENSATDLFATSLTATTLTVTADQNTVEEDLTGTITLMTENQRITFATIAVTQTAYGAPEITVSTNEWNAPAVGALTTEIAVDASADWTAESADAWLTVEKTDTGINLTAAMNEETTERSTKVTLTCTDGIRTAYEGIVVNQDGLAYITLSEESVSFGNEEGSATVTVESNFDWDYSYDTSNGWLKITRNVDALTITASANDSGDDREETITLTAGDGAENVAEVKLAIQQTQENALPLILTYTITSSNTGVGLPICGTDDSSIDCTVDWGDGTIETVTSDFPAHTFGTSGTYSISISGTVPAISNERHSSLVEDYLTGVEQWGNTGLKSMYYALCWCTKLSSLPADTFGAFADVTNFAYSFYRCSALTSLPAGLFDYATKTVSFFDMCMYCTKLSSLPDGLFANCGEATDFYGAFCYCALKTIPADLFSGCLKANDFQWTFGYSNGNGSSLTEIPKGLFDNCTLVTDFSHTFDGCTGITSIPEGLFDNCPEVTTFERTFYNCRFTSIPKGLFDKCTKVKTFKNTFYNCTSLTEIPTGLFDNCPEVTDFETTFWYCSKLTAIPEGLFSNNHEVTTFYYTFAGCTGITAIPERLFDGCTKATLFNDTFLNLSLVKTIPAGLFDSCTSATTFAQTFNGCSGLTEIPEGLFDNCPDVDSFTMVFQNCTSLTSIPKGLFDKCTKVTVCNYIFSGCTGITSIPENLFANLKNATSFRSTFSGCTALKGESAYDMVNGKMVHLYERTEELGYAEPTTTASCYTNCTGLDDYDDIPSTWK